jgi:hypothetical protein
LGTYADFFWRCDWDGDAESCAAEEEQWGEGREETHDEGLEIGRNLRKWNLERECREE